MFLHDNILISNHFLTNARQPCHFRKQAWETITSLNKIQKLLILFLFLVGDKHIKMHKGTAAPVQPQRLLLFAGHFNDTFMCQI